MLELRSSEEGSCASGLNILQVTEGGWPLECGKNGNWSQLIPKPTAASGITRVPAGTARTAHTGGDLLSPSVSSFPLGPGAGGSERLSCQRWEMVSES